MTTTATPPKEISALLARKKEAKRIFKSLDNVVLPAPLKKSILAAIAQIQNWNTIFDKWGLGEVIPYGRGITLLFHGPAGTGKTLIARKIAQALDYELKEIGTAELESCEPGQYERNLKAFFDWAKDKGKAILFFDECDAIIQSRVGMGQIMSAQNNALLKEIENYDGVLILATNRVNSLDSALERRISLTLEFPLPDTRARAKIWKAHLPKKFPLDPAVTPAELAKFELSGGQIKNCVLAAARLAIADYSDTVTPNHIATAIQQILTNHAAFAAPRLTGHQQRDYVVS